MPRLTGRHRGDRRQLREVVDRLRAAGQWRPGDPPILIVADAGYDITHLAAPVRIGTFCCYHPERDARCGGRPGGRLTVS